MSSSDAAAILEARTALAELDRAKEALSAGIRAGVSRDEKRRLMTARQIAAERVGDCERWAVDHVRGVELARQFASDKFCTDEQEERLIRWAERVSQ
jgi:hypothetical protein